MLEQTAPSAEGAVAQAEGGANFFRFFGLFCVGCETTSIVPRETGGRQKRFPGRIGQEL